VHTCVLAADTSRFTKSWPRVSSHGVPFSSLGVPGSTTCSEVRPDGERSDPNSVWGTPKAGNADNELLSRGVCCSETDTLKSQSLGELLTPMHRDRLSRMFHSCAHVCVYVYAMYTCTCTYKRCKMFGHACMDMCSCVHLICYTLGTPLQRVRAFLRSFVATVVYVSQTEAYRVCETFCGERGR